MDRDLAERLVRATEDQTKAIRQFFGDHPVTSGASQAVSSAARKLGDAVGEKIAAALRVQFDAGFADLKREMRRIADALEVTIPKKVFTEGNTGLIETDPATTTRAMPEGLVESLRAKAEAASIVWEDEHGVGRYTAVVSGKVWTIVASAEADVWLVYSPVTMGARSHRHGCEYRTEYNDPLSLADMKVIVEAKIRETR